MPLCDCKQISLSNTIIAATIAIICITTISGAATYYINTLQITHYAKAIMVVLTCLTCSFTAMFLVDKSNIIYSKQYNQAKKTYQTHITKTNNPNNYKKNNQE